MSVEVMETTEGMAPSAMSANEGTATGEAGLAGRTRAGASFCASRRGVTLTEPATTIPKITAAAISTEKESACLVDFCIWFRGSSDPVRDPGQQKNAGASLLIPEIQLLPFHQTAATHLYR